MEKLICAGMPRMKYKKEGRSLKLLVLDGNSIVNRAFYGIKMLTTKDGRYTNALVGFMNILLKLEAEVKPDEVAVAFDLKAPTFRHKMYDGYKAQRKGMPQELAGQLPVLKQLLAGLGYRMVTCEGFEADDILGTLSAACEARGDECVIATGDRDSLQLVGPHTRVLLAGTSLGKSVTVEMDEAAVQEKYGVTPRELIDVKSLMGDASDNMGCPAPKITGPGAGSALLKTPALAGQVARAVVQAAAGEVPVTVKLRIGWDAATLTGAEVAKRCEDAGVAMLTVHGRTRQEMYEPGIHADEIARVKAAVRIPVWANGDVASAQGALALLAATGCDGVAVGRGAMGNPWLFGQIAAAMAGSEIPPAPPLARRLAVMRRHVRELCEDKGEYIGMREARSHAAWYLHGLRGAAALRRMCCGMERFEDLDAVIARVWEYQREEA